jgi:hypothetical protein
MCPSSFPRKRESMCPSSFPRKRESMLSVSERDDVRKVLGNRWIPAFAGMTSPNVPAFAGMTIL